MPFKVSDTKSQHFKDIETLLAQLKVEERNTSRISISEFLKQDSRVWEDEFFGDKSHRVSFNDEGFKDFCQLLGVSSSLLKEIRESGLSTQVMNDRIPDRKYKLEEYDFVLDEKKQEVLGCVSNSYNDLSNQSFFNMLNEVPAFKLDDFEYSESYLINTKLTLRFLSKRYEAGKVRDEYGIGQDVSRIGVEFRNSMVGTSAISAFVFIRRLVCLNGMTIVTGGERGRVYHRGKASTFEERLDRRIKPVVRKMHHYRTWIEKLMDIEFNPEKLVENGAIKAIYEVYPLSREEKFQRDRLVGRKIREYDIKRISSLPDRLKNPITNQIFHSPFRNNATMFDFVNIFTEEANNLVPRKRLEKEEIAGKLANWIYENRKKFN